MSPVLDRLMRWFGPDRQQDHALETIGVSEPIRAAEAVAAYSRGVEQYRRGDLEPAARAFRQALDLKHDLAEAHFYLGLISRKQSRLEEAGRSLPLKRQPTLFTQVQRCRKPSPSLLQEHPSRSLLPTRRERT